MYHWSQDAHPRHVSFSIYNMTFLICRCLRLSTFPCSLYTNPLSSEWSIRQYHTLSSIHVTIVEVIRWCCSGAALTCYGELVPAHPSTIWNKYMSQQRSNSRCVPNSDSTNPTSPKIITQVQYPRNASSIPGHNIISQRPCFRDNLRQPFLLATSPSPL